MTAHLWTGKRIVCPECPEKKPKKYAIQIVASSRVDYSHPLAIHDFIDADGYHHQHTDNHESAVFKCSAGHQWQVDYAPDCPAGCECSLTHQMRETKT